MVERPERHLDDFAKAGADHITIHVEATPHVHYALQAIHEAGLHRRLRALPGARRWRRRRTWSRTSTCAVHDRQPRLGRPRSSSRTRSASSSACGRCSAPGPAIEVDGGIDVDNAGPVRLGGATVFVAGTAVFGAADPRPASRRSPLPLSERCSTFARSAGTASRMAAYPLGAPDLSTWVTGS